MKKVISSIKDNKVLSGSFVMVIGGFFGSFTNYLYHLVIARQLGPLDYGLLDSLISLLYQLSIPLATITLVITKYVSLYKGQNRTKMIETFFWKINKKIFQIVPILIVLIIILTPTVTKFLHLPNPLLFIWIGLAFIFGIFSAIGKSFLQGLSKFIELSITGVIDGTTRLFFTVILLSFGFGLTGAIIPFFLSALISVAYLLFIEKELIRGDKKEKITEKKEILKFIFPVFLANIGATSMITSDIILARHFLNPIDAGYYSALSTLGKIIFFAATPVIGVIFPIISEHHAARKNTNKILLQGFGMILLIGLGIFIMFGIFPNVMVSMLFGVKYVGIGHFVFPMAIALLLYTINYALINVFLAMKIVFPTVLLGLAAVLQIVLIFLFHQNIQQIINIFIFISALLLTVLLLYYAYVQKKTSFSNSSRI
jgi:O-antigen/teichoic acid export membrane protein